MLITKMFDEKSKCFSKNKRRHGSSTLSSEPQSLQVGPVMCTWVVVVCNTLLILPLARADYKEGNKGKVFQGQTVFIRNQDFAHILFLITVFTLLSQLKIGLRHFSCQSLRGSIFICFHFGYDVDLIMS